MAKKRIQCTREGYSDPDLRCSIMNKVFKSARGGRAYQWSARKAQLVSKMYKEAGGKFSSRKTRGQMSLEKWTNQDWTTKSGKPSLQTGERYLPRKAIRKLTNEQYRRTTAAKRAGTRQGKQFVRQPKDVSKITKRYRQRSHNYTFHTKATHMNDQNYQQLMADGANGVVLIWFYAPWCGHCQDFAPVYDMVCDELSNENSYMAVCVNIDENPIMVGEYSIDSVPTIYKVKNNKRTMYNGSRTKEDIMTFVMN